MVACSLLDGVVGADASPITRLGVVTRPVSQLKALGARHTATAPLIPVTPISIDRARRCSAVLCLGRLWTAWFAMVGRGRAVTQAAAATAAPQTARHRAG
jgi:hypothetical protein